MAEKNTRAAPVQKYLPECPPLLIAYRAQGIKLNSSNKASIISMKLSSVIMAISLIER